MNNNNKPVISFSGPVTQGAQVMLFSHDGRTVYYTSDLTDPSFSATRAAYTQPLCFKGDVTIKACCEGCTAQASETFLVSSLPAPSFSLKDDRLEIIAPIGLKLAYRKGNGAFQVYDGPIELSDGDVVEAYGLENRGDSIAETMVASYSYSPSSELPKACVKDLFLGEKKLVTLSGKDKIEFRIDGSAFALYDQAISISRPCKLDCRTAGKANAVVKRIEITRAIEPAYEIETSMLRLSSPKGSFIYAKRSSELEARLYTQPIEIAEDEEYEAFCISPLGLRSKTISICRSSGFPQGYCFYDKGEETEGWRYLKAADTDLQITGSDGFVSNAFSYGSDGVLTGADSDGLSNTLKMDLPFIKALGEGWFIPSRSEMAELLRYFNNVIAYSKSKGEPIDLSYFGFDKPYYMTSTEADKDHCIVLRTFGMPGFEYRRKTSDPMYPMAIRLIKRM
ncbi:MAG: chitobiase/beta-hexosaminidase C-terminal domain-containing protein [Sphaerochaetaceae bacterium]